MPIPAVYLASLLAPIAGQAVDCYLSHGWHGGYYLTTEADYGLALDELFALLDQAPVCKVSLELEPYTLERMWVGEVFDVERRGRQDVRVAFWGYGGPGRNQVQFIADAARAGRLGARLRLEDGAFVHVCQGLGAADLAGASLRFSAWVRNLGGNAHLYVDAHRGGTVIPGSGVMTKPVPSDGAWHHVELEYTVPAGAEIIYPQARLTSEPGQADFDELSLVRSADGAELLRNGGFEQAGTPTLKDPGRLQRLRDLVASGRVEIVGGAYTQPILYMLGQESAMQQFVLGCRAVEECVGAPVRIYAAQEPDWAGQLPQILTQMGFRGAIYRTNWQAFGAAPARDADFVAWVGPDGTRLPTVPMPAAMRTGWGMSGPSSELLRRLSAAGITRPYFHDLGDFISSWVLKPSDPRAHGQWLSGLVNLCRELPAGAVAGTELELSAWLRPRQPGAHLYIDSYRGPTNLGGQETTCLPPDGEWHRLSLRYHVPPDADRLYPQVRIYAQAPTGDVDVDGVSLRVLETGQELLPEAGFEETGLPPGWSAGQFGSTLVSAQVMGGKAQQGERYVNLRMTAAPLSAALLTPSEYFALLGEPREEWPDAYAEFEHRYPWGIMAGYHLRADRAMERDLLAALRADAMLGLGVKARRDDLWRLILIGHHHDAWVCGPLPAFGIWSAGYPRYADLTVACEEELSRALSSFRPPQPQEGHAVSICNTAAVPWIGVQRLTWTLPAGACHVPLVTDSRGHPLPATVEVTKRHPDGSAQRVEAGVRIDLPALGWRQCRLVEAQARTQPPLPSVTIIRRNGAVRLENHQVGVELSREGLQLFRAGRPLLSSPAHLAGHFPQGLLASSFENITAQQGPAEATATATGAIGSVGLVLTIRLPTSSPILLVELRCDFGDRTLVGEGPDQPPLRPPWSHEDRKLRWVFPLAEAQPTFLTHGAFELRQPSREDWPVLDVALAQGAGDGLALFPDRATSGLFRPSPPSLEIVVAYGGSFMYAPGGASALQGTETYELAIYPYAGSPESAAVVQSAETALPGSFITVTDPARLPGPDGQLVHIHPATAAALSTCFADGPALILRLWRPYEGDRQLTVQVPGARELHLADPAGRALTQLAAGPQATFTMRSHQILTLRALR